MTIKTVAVLGTGQMGRGIAQVCAQSSFAVLVADIDLATAAAGQERIASSLQRLVDKGKLEASARDEALGRIKAVDGIGGFGAADMVIEAVSENESLKQKLFAQLDEVLPAGAVLATNTSSISVTRLAAVTQRAEAVIGMHFMNPVPVMKLVEVIRGFATSDATYDATVEMAQKLGKTVVTSADYPGFIVNRILMPMINEAAYTLMEGVANAEDIDAAMKLGTNQPMGPLTLADFIGLDTCLAIMEVLHEGLGDSKYRPCPMLRRLVDAGRLGKKTGWGFHRY